MSTSSTNANNASSIANFSPARFTKEEKSVLYELFRDNEEIIDIKHRRNSTKKNVSVRECWDRIAALYNDNPDITTLRNVKQIQKFWLNARLRKHYPSGSGGITNHHKSSGKSKSKVISKFETINIQDYADDIKYEKECETDEIEMLNPDDDNLQEEVEISTSSMEVLLDTNNPHQYNIDHISAEKLTLNDLLEFKNSRSSRDEIVLQIKSPDSLGLSGHHQKDGSVGGGPLQTYTTTSYRISNPNSATALVAEQYPTIQQQVISQQLTTQSHKNNTGQNICCGSGGNRNSTNTNSQSRSPPSTVDSFEEKIVYYRLKEAELKFKEEQLKWEQTKIELAHAKEKLKHAKELHALEIDEIKLKLKLLGEKDKVKVIADKIIKDS